MASILYPYNGMTNVAETIPQAEAQIGSGKDEMWDSTIPCDPS